MLSVYLPGILDTTIITAAACWNPASLREKLVSTLVTLIYSSVGNMKCRTGYLLSWMISRFAPFLIMFLIKHLLCRRMHFGRTILGMTVFPKQRHKYEYHRTAKPLCGRQKKY